MRKFWSLLTILFIIFALTSTVFAENEENNSYETANTLSINSSDSGSINGTYDWGKDRYDYYKITIPSDGSLNVQINSTVKLYDVRLNLMQTNNVAVLVNFDTARDYDMSEGYTVSGTTLAAGTYYVQIVGDDLQGTYSISNTFTPISHANDESSSITNDKLENAISLKLNTTKEGHIGYRSDIGNYDTNDFYKLTLSNSGSLDISIICDEIFNDVRLTRLQDNGVLVLVNFDTARDYDGSDGGYRVYDNDLEAGDYYLKLDNKQDIAGGYSINTSSNTSEPDPDPEPKPEPEPEPDKSYDNWTKTNTTDISPSKTWTITFNQNLDSNYLSTEYIYIKDANGKKLDTNLNFDTNKKVLISSPTNNYDSGKIYTLYVENQIKSTENKFLSTGIKMDFTIKGSSNNYNEGTLTHNGFDFSENELRLDNVPWDSEFDGRKDGSLVFWEPVLGNQHDEGLWIRYGDENILKNITADLGKVDFDSVSNISDATFEEVSPKLQIGHIYIIKTREDGYAKIEILSLDTANTTASIRWDYSNSGSF